MKRVWRLVAVVLVAVGVRANEAAAVQSDGSVTAVSVVPATGRAELVIAVTGKVTARDFTLRNPDRIVVDITGATLGITSHDAYDRVSRGGIANVRFSQFRQNIVRVVITLGVAHKYSVVHGQNEIRVSLPATDSKFAEWHTGGGATVVASAAPAAMAPVTKAPATKAPVIKAPANKAAPVTSPAVELQSSSVSPLESKSSSTPAASSPVIAAPAATTPVATTPPVAASAVAASDIRIPTASSSPVESPAATAPVVEVARQEDTTPYRSPRPAPTLRLAGEQPADAVAVTTVADERAVTVMPGATPAPVRTLSLRPQAQDQPRISITWEGADIHDVLAAFASFARKTIIPSKDVSGTITAEIINQPWDVAMRAILNANGFDATEDENGIIIVDTFEHIAQRRAAAPLSTRTIRLNYARATQVAPLLTPRLSRDCGAMAPNVSAGDTPIPGGAVSLSCPVRGAVTADSLTNSVSVTDVPSALDAIEEYARSVDIRQPQVNIKAKIILVDRTQLEALGLRYDIGTREQFFNSIVPRLDSTGKPRADAGQVFLGGNAVSAIANATARVPGAALQLVYSTALGRYDFSTFLEALQTNSLLDVQAEPSASVLNNHTANLTAGTQVPVRVIEAGTGGNAGGAFPRATVNFQQTGIILNVTPQVTNNHQVQMTLHVENSDVQFQSNDIGAVFPKQSVDNVVLVADGETAVMGGLTQTTVRISKTGIPILVDLPLIGRLFGSTQREETKRDLLILITPHIIDNGDRPTEPNAP